MICLNSSIARADENSVAGVDAGVARGGRSARITIAMIAVSRSQPKILCRQLLFDIALRRSFFEIVLELMNTGPHLRKRIIQARVVFSTPELRLECPHGYVRAEHETQNLFQRAAPRRTIDLAGA